MNYVTDLTKEYEEALCDRKVNLHILERMKQTKIHLDLRTSKLMNRLKNKKLVSTSEEM
jgi:hypothetical protein